MDEKRRQIETAWQVSEGFDRVRKKISENKAPDNPEVALSNLINKHSEKMADIDRAWKEHGENKPNYEKMNQTISSIYPQYNELKGAEGDRRNVFLDVHANAEGYHSVGVYQDKLQEVSDNKSSEIVYKDFIDIPAHWSNKQAENFFEMSLNGSIISEYLFDKYIKSNAKDVSSFLAREQSKKEAIKLVKERRDLP